MTVLTEANRPPTSTGRPAPRVTSAASRARRAATGPTPPPPAPPVAAAVARGWRDDAAADAGAGVGAGAAPAREPLGRRFGVHLGGVGLANLADGVIVAGLPLIAVSLTRSPGQVSLLSVAVWLPWLLLGLIAGVVIDRQDRRVVQLVGMTGRVVALAGLAVLAFTDQLSIGWLVALAFVYGVTEVFVDLAASSMVPDLVPRSRLSAANGRVLGAQQALSTFAGAPLGGLLVVLGAGWVAGVPAALCFAFVLLIGFGLRGSYRAPAAPTAPVAGGAPAASDVAPVAAVRRSVRSDVVEGAGLLWRHPVLRPILLSSSVTNMANTAYFAVFVLWVVGAESRVGLQPQHFPLLLTFLAVGAVLSTLLVERLQRVLPEIRLMQVSWLVNASMLLVPVIWPSALAIAVAMFVLGFTNTIGNVIGQTVRQRLVPRHLLGRVGGASRTIGYGLMPVGALLGGLVGESFGLATVFVAAAVLCLLMVLYVMSRVSQALVARHELP